MGIRQQWENKTVDYNNYTFTFFYLKIKKTKKNLVASRTSVCVKDISPGSQWS